MMIKISGYMKAHWYSRKRFVDYRMSVPEDGNVVRTPLWKITSIQWVFGDYRVEIVRKNRVRLVKWV